MPISPPLCPTKQSMEKVHCMMTNFYCTYTSPHSSSIADITKPNFTCAAQINCVAEMKENIQKVLRPWSRRWKNSRTERKAGVGASSVGTEKRADVRRGAKGGGQVGGSILVVSMLRAHCCPRQWPLIGLPVGGPAGAAAAPLDSSPLDTVFPHCEASQRRNSRGSLKFSKHLAAT
ncbi:hypothetical protein SRHO_G00045120 [Serrasalmus rhombeus]